MYWKLNHCHISKVIYFSFYFIHNLCNGISPWLGDEFSFSEGNFLAFAVVFKIHVWTVWIRSFIHCCLLQVLVDDSDLTKRRESIIYVSVVVCSVVRADELLSVPLMLGTFV